LVRADITYIRQDFSVQQPAPTPGTTNLTNQRFDYLVRVRLLGSKDAKKLAAEVKELASYPQRDAVLFALRELTGKNLGNTTEAWVQLAGRNEAE